MGPTVWECILRLVLSALFGGFIGLERELRMKGAGIRTHLIVSFASCMMTLVSKYAFFDMMELEAVKLDPSRVTAGVVTAIGFIGAGAISARRRSITGMTTAAGLWATVGIGMAMGAGMYYVSTFGAVFIVVIQAVLHRDHALGSSAVICIQIDDQPEALDCFQAELAKLKLEPSSSRYERADGVLSIELQISRLPCPERKLDCLLSPLMKQPYVKSVLW
ncbi:MAG: MgtC/SapB family protein [Oscillospiraceae bacterium]|nr:MgtC/SapB family protein [Oscillospiraceae bacterium]